jgi:lipid II:glycine glycyltransferase (peptidoglycan interpeptide bridge formation enzyme)
LIRDHSAEQLQGPLRDWVRSIRAIAAVDFGSFGMDGGWGPLEETVERVEFLVTPGSREELLKQMRKGTRSSIKKAQRAGVTVELAEDQHAVQDFVKLYGSTLRRLEEKKQIPAPGLDESKFAKNLSGLVGESRGRLYLARHDRQTIAGCFFGVFGRSPYYLYNGSTAEALALGANPLTLLNAMEDLFSLGSEQVNLGGAPADAADPSSPDHGLFRFKLGMGSTPYTRRGGRWTPRPVRLALGVRARELIRR